MRYRLFFFLIFILTVGCRPSKDDEAKEVLNQATETLAYTVSPVPTFEPTVTISIPPTTNPTLTSTSAPEIQVISYQVSALDGMGMVLVPEGEFQMGSEEGWESERPVHSVYLSSYWIDQTEVTNQQYQLCIDAEACDTPGDLDSFTREEYFTSPAFSEYPVINVSWYDAQNYCQWAGRRLPTEAEWEKAARGIEGNVYPWGDGITCELANFIGCLGDTSAVGSYPLGASPYGVLDLSGNVWEWVSDWYFIGYYEESPLDYPLGPDSGAYRVVRGGSWNDYDWYLRTTTRYSYFPDNERVSIGFRCALGAAE